MPALDREGYNESRRNSARMKRMTMYQPTILVGRRRAVVFGGCIILHFLSILFVVFVPHRAESALGDCPAGYFFDRNSGVGCKQTNCNEIENAHWSYEGRCVCGSSGSENEKLDDPNKECFLPHADTSCPDCIVKCVHFNEKCPSEFGIKEDVPIAESTGFESASFFDYVKDAFGQLFSVGADLVEAMTDIKTQDTTTDEEFYTGRVILPGGDSFGMRLFHGNFEWSDDKGIAFEFNVIEITSPSKTAWIDNWSIGIGIGSASKDGVSPPIPNTPISPGISFRNIGNWFSLQYSDIRAWYRDNAPWYIGGDEPSPIRGMGN